MGWVERFNDGERLNPAKQPHRHVWVLQTREYGSREPWAGLLIEWRKDPAGRWFGLVAVVAGGVGNGLGVSWVAAELLVPTRADPPPTSD